MAKIIFTVFICLFFSNATAEDIGLNLKMDLSLSEIPKEDLRSDLHEDQNESQVIYREASEESVVWLTSDGRCRTDKLDLIRVDAVMEVSIDECDSFHKNIIDSLGLLSQSSRDALFQIKKDESTDIDQDKLVRLSKDRFFRSSTQKTFSSVIINK